MFTTDTLRYHQRILDEIATMRGGVPATVENGKAPVQIDREAGDHIWAANMVSNVVNPAFRYI